MGRIEKLAGRDGLSTSKHVIAIDSLYIWLQFFVKAIERAQPA